MNEEAYLKKVYDKSYYDTLSVGSKFEPSGILQNSKPNMKMLKMLEPSLMNLKYYHAKRAIYSHEKPYAKLLSNYDLNVKEFLILGLLHEKQLPQRDVCIEGRLGRSQCSVWYGKLREKGYVKPKTTHRFSLNIITDKGREIFKEIYSKLLELDKEIL